MTTFELHSESFGWQLVLSGTLNDAPDVTYARFTSRPDLMINPDRVSITVRPTTTGSNLTTLSVHVSGYARLKDRNLGKKYHHMWFPQDVMPDWLRPAGQALLARAGTILHERLR